MELVSHPDPTTLASGRATRIAAAGIALAGAGMIAVNPIAPALQDFRHQDVQLVSWESLIERTNENLAALTENSNVNTLLEQYASNQSDYLQLIIGMEDVPLDHREGMSPRFVTSGFAGINEALDKMINGADGTVGGDHDRYPGLEQLMSQISEALQNGNAFEAFNHFNIWLLYGLEDIGKALGPVLSIPALEAMNQSSLLNEFIGPLDGWTLIKQASDALMAPTIGALYQLTQSLTAASGGDFEALFNLPADLLNSYLNGYVVPETGDVFTGLLTEGGIYDLLTNEWAARAAEALTVGTAHLPVNVAESADAGADLWGGDFLSSLFDGSLWGA
ncbi:hypothetical protein [Mycolicibacter longobardus]|uniref:PE-PGRS family protein n=1 Tax=Mycolicibacter longobardus TaxID=1108812 RepID=A0A1X1YG35_9MYCO|nr:hypothetical protein [Mycolicibacter longobardus]MCV7383181.1 hypothetical protein [Mycolicibacter longobardus]ORW10058.1 hypothetical protein AWC16_14595 [Mycolicibacter longobardus]